jgi:hypothetical protein
VTVLLRLGHNHVSMGVRFVHIGDTTTLQGKKSPSCIEARH